MWGIISTASVVFRFFLGFSAQAWNNLKPETRLATMESFKLGLRLNFLIRLMRDVYVF